MRIFIIKTAQKQLLKIPYKIRLKIENNIEVLVKSPFPRKAKKLSGRPGWRLRIGDYRMLYFVDKKKKKILILSIQHRKDAYR